MKKFLILSLALVLGGCSAEPSFEGLPASYWLQQLKSKDPMTRARAAYYARQMGPRAKKAIPDLIDLLDDDKAVVRYEAAVTLGSLGPDAQAAVPALTKLLNDPILSVREAAGYSIDRIDPNARAKATRPRGT